MMRFTLFFALLCSCLVSHGQAIQFYQGNQLKFARNPGDTVAYPFVGGFIAPQFSEMDLNDDGIKDLVVMDRSGDKVLCFLNLGIANTVSYVYAPGYEDYFPPVGGWMLLRDYNCDGKEDIFTTPESNLITIYKNVSQGGKLAFEHITVMLCDTLGSNIPASSKDIPAIDDIDGDGDLDILTFDGFGTPILFQNLQKEENAHCDSLRFRFADNCWGSFTEGDNSIIHLGVNCGYKSYYKNAKHTGGTLLTLDMDGDGDNDLLMGDPGSASLFFLKNGKAEYSWPYDTLISYSSNFPSNTDTVNINSFVASFYIDLNNDGRKDLITTNSESVEGTTNLNQVWWYKNSGQNNAPVFQFMNDNFLQNATLDFGSNTAPAFFDTDGDGDQDLLLVTRGNWLTTKNQADRIIHFENTGNTNQAVFQMKSQDYMGFSTTLTEGMNLTFGDLDKDGLSDMLMGNKSGKMAYYKNTGTLSVPAFTLIDSFYSGIDILSYSTPYLYDVDGDSLLDILAGNVTGNIAYFRNRGTAQQASFLDTPDVAKVGKILVNQHYYQYVYDDITAELIDSVSAYVYDGFSSVNVADLNNDGDLEIICGGFNGQLRIYPFNTQAMNDSFPEILDYFETPATSIKTVFDVGSKCVPAIHDLNGDGIPDILVGTSRGGLTYLSSKYDSVVNNINPSLAALQGRVYPNPANASFQLIVDGDINTIVQVELLDILGRSFLKREMNTATQKSETIYTENLEPGVYFINLKAENFRQQTIKILVIR